MADTIRTAATLLASLFQDGQADGSISAQDHRDFIVSTAQQYGCIYISSSAATTISVAGTYVKAAGTTTLAASSADVDMPTDNRLRYTGAPDKVFLIAAPISSTCAASNQVLAYAIGKNGTPDTSTQIKRKIGTGSDVGAMAVGTVLTLSTNDYVELFVANDTTTGNVTVDFCNIIIWAALS